MKLNKPFCDFKYCRYHSDGNCFAEEIKRERCLYLEYVIRATKQMADSFSKIGSAETVSAEDVKEVLSEFEKLGYAGNITAQDIKTML